MLTSLAYIFLVGLLLGYLFKRIGLPSLIGMLLTGIILGPFVLNVLDEKLLSVSTELRRIALVIILLRAGLALNIAELKKVGRSALLMCFVPACCEIIGMIVVGPRFLGLSLVEAAVLGTVVAAVSPAVIVPKMISMIEHGQGTRRGIPQMIMAAGSVDDVFVIVLFTAATTLAQGGEVAISSFVGIPVAIVLGLFMGVAVGWLLSVYFRHFHMRDSVKLLIMMSIAFLFLEVEDVAKPYVDISGLLAVMSMGVVILFTHPVLARRISPKYSKIWVAAEVMLFVLVGATININYAMEAGLCAVAVILLALIWRVAGVWISLIGTDLSFRDRCFCMVAYTPKATVQAAIGGLPLAMGLGCGEIVLTVAVLAILITAPLGLWGMEHVGIDED